jgi:hypothetical protein
LDEAIGDAAHGGNDDDNFVTLAVILRNAGSDVLDPVGICDRCATIFLNN